MRCSPIFLPAAGLLLCGLLTSGCRSFDPARARREQTDAFTTNLADGSGFLQVGISLSTFYDGKVIGNIKRQQVPIRSVVLMVLAEQDPALLSTSHGKQSLQRLLTAAINQVLRDKEGFGGIDNVYFTSLVIQ